MAAADVRGVRLGHPAHTVQPPTILDLQLDAPAPPDRPLQPPVHVQVRPHRAPVSPAHRLVRRGGRGRAEQRVCLSARLRRIRHPRPGADYARRLQAQDRRPQDHPPAGARTARPDARAGDGPHASRRPARRPGHALAGLRQHQVRRRARWHPAISGHDESDRATGSPPPAQSIRSLAMASPARSPAASMGAGCRSRSSPRRTRACATASARLSRRATRRAAIRHDSTAVPSA